jgi:N-acetylmuramic acid 6-phosphate etherase
MGPQGGERVVHDAVEALGGLDRLDTERVNAATADLDRLSPLAIVRAMNAEDATVADAVAAELPRVAAAVEEITARLRRGGRLVYVGAGTSGRLGVLDAAECPPTFGTPPELVVGLIAGGPTALTEAVEAVEDRAEAGRDDAARLGITDADAVVGIAASGRTPYVLGAVAHARGRGAFTVGLACNRGTPLEAAVALMIAPVVGPEVIAGSTRLKAGTAQKMVLNMLSTGAMVLLGKTYGNLMVDLRATNAKLRRRAVGIVRAATGLDETGAAALLRASGGEAKTAIVAARAGIDPPEARARLAAAGGSVRAALGEEPR